MLSKVWDEITYPFPSYNSTTMEFGEWTSNFISYIIMDVITCPCWGRSQNILVKGGPGCCCNLGYPSETQISWNLIFLTDFFSRPIIWKFECIMVDDVILCAKFQNDWTSGINHWWMTFHKVAINSLWPRDTIWRHGSGSKLAQVMACCLMAPSHYLNQCWLIISEVWWHFSEDNFTIDAS